MKVLLPAPVTPITGMMMAEGGRFRANVIVASIPKSSVVQGNEM
jgi:hypothetical protein